MKDYFKLTVEAEDNEDSTFYVNVNIDGSCDREMCIKALHHMLNQLENECKDDLHEAFHLFLSDRGY